jgi:hypothetical protein
MHRIDSTCLLLTEGDPAIEVLVRAHTNTRAGPAAPLWFVDLTDTAYSSGRKSISENLTTKVRSSHLVDDVSNLEERLKFPSLVSPTQIHNGAFLVAMEPAVLRDRIVATLDPDADARRRAELDLKTVSHSTDRVVRPSPNSRLAGRGTSWLHRCAP